LSGLGHTPEPLFAARGVLARHETKPGRKITSAAEVRHVGRKRLDRQRDKRAYARHRLLSPHRIGTAPFIPFLRGNALSAGRLSAGAAVAF